MADDNVLRLKIAMHQHARKAPKPLGNFTQRRQAGDGGDVCLVDLEISAKTVFKEVILFPAIKSGIEFAGQIFPECHCNPLSR